MFERRYTGVNRKRHRKRHGKRHGKRHSMFKRRYWSEPKRHRKRHRERHRAAKEQPQQANVHIPGYFLATKTNPKQTGDNTDTHWDFEKMGGRELWITSTSKGGKPRWEICFLVFFVRPKNTCFLVFLGQLVFFSAAGAFFFRGGRFIINITITLSLS